MLHPCTTVFRLGRQILPHKIDHRPRELNYYHRAESSEERKATYLGLIEKSINKLDTFIQSIINYSRNARLTVGTYAHRLQCHDRGNH